MARIQLHSQQQHMPTRVSARMRALMTVRMPTHMPRYTCTYVCMHTWLYARSISTLESTWYGYTHVYMQVCTRKIACCAASSQRRSYIGHNYIGHNYIRL